jgi:hypothetical protein
VIKKNIQVYFVTQTPVVQPHYSHAYIISKCTLPRNYCCWESLYLHLLGKQSEFHDECSEMGIWVVTSSPRTILRHYIKFLKPPCCVRPSLWALPFP